MCVVGVLCRCVPRETVHPPISRFFFFFWFAFLNVASRPVGRKQQRSDSEKTKNKKKSPVGFLCRLFCWRKDVCKMIGERKRREEKAPFYVECTMMCVRVSVVRQRDRERERIRALRPSLLRLGVYGEHVLIIITHSRKEQEKEIHPIGRIEGRRERMVVVIFFFFGVMRAHK